MNITPDTKNWTWVLERPCLECGFVAEEIPINALGGLLEEWAERWRLVLARNNVGVRPAPDVWSPLEYSCHVRDVMRVFDKRVQLMLTELDPLFDNWDQDETAVLERYGHQDPVVVAEELAHAASALDATFANVTAEAWNRTGRRSDGSHFTVDSIGRYFSHDVVHHLHDVGG